MADRTFSLRRLDDLCRGGVGRAFIIDPTDLEVVAFLATLEGEFHIRVLGDAAAPVSDEHRLAVIFEGQLLDEVRRNDLALDVLDEAGIHRVLDQRLHFGDVAGRAGARANGRCHRNTPSLARQPPQPPTVTLTSLVAL